MVESDQPPRASGSNDLLPEGLHRLIVDAVVDGILVTDGGGRVLEANAAAAAMTGHSRDELLSRRLADLLRLESGAGPSAGGGDPRGWFRGSLRRADGELVIVDGATSTVPGSDPPLTLTMLRNPMRAPSGEPSPGELLRREQEARQAAEQAWERLALVSEISELLAEWTDYPQALTRLAQLLAERSADICAIDLVDEHGRVRRAAAVHTDPARQPLVDRMHELMSLGADSHPAVAAIRTGEPVIVEQVSAELIESALDLEELRELVRELGYRSVAAMPLVARQRVVGAISLISTRPERRFSDADVPALAEIARRVAVRLDNARLYAERDEIARALQAALLPARLPAVPGWTLAARYQTADRGQVGGDFYDVIELPGGRVLAIVGDVCGKGAQAAAVTGLARHTIRATSMRETSPAGILLALNKVLLADEASTRFLTACCVRLDPRSGRAQVCVAGHPPPLLVTGSTAAVVPCSPGLILGEFPGPALTETELTVPADAALLLYTDGLLGGGGDVDGMVARLIAGLPAVDAAHLADAAVHSGCPEQAARETTDDVAVVVLRRAGAEADAGRPATEPEEGRAAG